MITMHLRTLGHEMSWIFSTNTEHNTRQITASGTITSRYSAAEKTLRSGHIMYRYRWGKRPTILYVPVMIFSQILVLYTTSCTLLHSVRRRLRQTFSTRFEIFQRRVDGVMIYFFNSDFKFFDDASEFSVCSIYVVFIFC